LRSVAAPYPGHRAGPYPVGDTEADALREEERLMGDKSPKKNTSKAAPAKSLKEKRAEKRSKTDKKG
jgi:hypothetical protein